MATLSFLPCVTRSALVGVLLVGAGCAADHSESSDNDPSRTADTNPGHPSDEPIPDDSVPAVVPESDLDLPVLQGEGFELVEEVVLPRRKVSFYELEDGSLLTVKVGQLGNTSTSPGERGLSGANLYSLLTGKAAPQRLIRAESMGNGEAGRIAQNESEPAGEKALPGCDRVQGGCYLPPYTRENFLMENCTAWSGYLNILETWWTGTSAPGAVSSRKFNSAVLSNQGTVRFEAKFNGLKGSTYRYVYMLISQDRYVEFYGQAASLFNSWSKVYQAEGDIFDHCLHWTTRY
jgi:hypothetical protein